MKSTSSATTSSRVGSVSSPMISRSAHGLPCAARPTINRRSARRREHGVCARPATSRRRRRSPGRRRARRASPSASGRRCLCTSAASPIAGEASMSARRRRRGGGPSSRHVREPFSTPRLIFTLTGSGFASATACTSRQAWSGSSSIEAPAPVLVTFLTGQPKLMSTISAPAAATIPRGHPPSRPGPSRRSGSPAGARPRRP